MKQMTLVLLFLVAIPALAKKDRAPLPKEILSAKTIYLDNQSQYAEVMDNAVTELKKWNRLKAVSERKDADLVFTFTSSTEAATSKSTGTVIGSNVIVRTSPSSICAITLTISKPPSETVWTNTKPCSRKGATTDLMRDLRDRISSQP